MHSLYGKVVKYVPERGFGIILGENKQTYIVLQSWLNGEQIEKGYFVSFVPFKNDRSDYNARNVCVIYTPGKRYRKNLVPTKRKVAESISLAMQIRLLGLMTNSRDLLGNLCMSKN